ncbi:hypothetical protein BDQ12DRAFT_678664 [Crucibulum laeve]|uniref:F-box domain-containing protein n=1 Tax=Crucibulum laeve TaxID=68775 RepID=A0A5C3M956_9AGAR|nr:hypothetical protein BDQ12DRAFT_678664 [Crucibulum laeve]
MSTFPRCINDLIPVILDSDNHWWPRDLLRLARVSTEWLIHVRRRIYTCPTLLSFKACFLLCRTLTESSHLLALINAIDLRPAVIESCADRPLSMKDRSSIRFLLGMEGLHAISLGGRLAVKAERFLASISEPHTVKELCIDGSQLRDVLRCPPSLEWDESIAARFSSLNKLHLRHIELDVIFSSPSCTPPIADLILDNVNIISGYLLSILPVPPTTCCLRISTKSAAECDEHVALILEACSVESLEYEVQEDSTAENCIFDTITVDCPSLRSLHLNGVRIDSNTLLSISLRCMNLEELVVFGRMVHITAGEWVQFMNVGSLSSLKRLGLPEGICCPPFKAWEPAIANTLTEASVSQQLILLP